LIAGGATSVRASLGGIPHCLGCSPVRQRQSASPDSPARGAGCGQGRQPSCSGQTEKPQNHQKSTRSPSRITRNKKQEMYSQIFSSLPGIGEGLESLKLTLVPSQATRAGITLARDERVELRRNRSRCELHNIVTAICCVIPQAGPQSAFANCRGKKSRLLHIARWAVRDELKSQSPAAFELRPQCPFGTFPPITP
jgi:hypothetical protein